MNQARRQGFTIIELSLAMTFISMLLLAIVMAGIHAGNIYNKGIVLESVNQAGRDIGDTLRRDFLQSEADIVASGDPVILLQEADGRVRSGRFCLGGYSYLWNSPDVINGQLTGGPIVTQGGEPINFVRVVDHGGSLCVSTSGSYILNLDGRQLTHLLKQEGGTGVVLSIYDVAIGPVAHVSDSREGLFSLSYTIGTSETSEINTSSQLCRAPSEAGANDNFCAINQFETIVRTNG